MNNNTDTNIEAEFAEICMRASALPAQPKEFNPKKNRYSNCLPYENYRVRLNSQEDDYINASIWKLDSCPTKYTATQAPLESTVDDFWNMVNQENCRIIVSLIANDKKHCRYWESPRVKITSLESFPDFDKKSLILDDMLKIWHFQYTGWPDHSVPLRNYNLARLVLAVEKVRDEALIDDVVVHCSAGMGRTGTFASILLHRQTKMPLTDLVFELRKRRHRSLVVESIAQYNVIYDTLAYLKPCPKE